MPTRIKRGGLGSHSAGPRGAVLHQVQTLADGQFRQVGLSLMRSFIEFINEGTP